MKIALLAHNLHQAGGRSVGLGITSHFPKIAPDHEYLITIPKDCGYDELKTYPNVTVMELPVGSMKERFFFERRLKRRLRKWGCHWCWILGNNLFVMPKTRCSLLLHSSYYLNYPFEKLGIPAKSLRRRVERFFVKKTVLRSQHVYGQTQTVCRRIRETYSIGQDRVFQCPMAFYATQSLKDSSDWIPAAQILRKASSQFRLLYVSAFYPQKNYSRIIDLFCRYRAELVDVTCFLTLSPQAKEGIRLLEQRVAENGLANNIVFLGSVPYEKIDQVYRNADAVFYPTLLETVGFGHLEGMCFDLPVIASDLDFAREVCGQAALFVDPFSLESMKDGILQLKNDPILRQALIKKGQERLRSIPQTWEAALQNVLTIEKIPTKEVELDH